MTNTIYVELATLILRMRWPVAGRYMSLESNYFDSSTPLATRVRRSFMMWDVDKRSIFHGESLRDIIVDPNSFRLLAR
jgi:hypothetical protein